MSFFDRLRFRLKAWLLGWDVPQGEFSRPIGPLRDSRVWVCTNCEDRSPPFACHKCGSSF